jgi:hypothetical protein
MGVDFRLFGEFIKGTDNWISLSFMKARQEIDGEVSPMPTDQLFNLSIFFQDYIPGFERLRGSLLGHLAQGLPAYPPGGNDYGNNAMRSTSYRRLDLGLTYLLIGEDFDIRQRSAFWGVFRSLTIGVEVFNLFDIQNISAYSWITDIFNQQHSVPNYLTSRLLNLTITAQF